MEIVQNDQVQQWPLEEECTTGPLNDVNIQNALEDILYLQEPLALIAEVRPTSIITKTDCYRNGQNIYEYMKRNRKRISKDLKVVSKGKTKLCQQIWRKTEWPTDSKRSVYMPTHTKGTLNRVYEL